MIKKNSIKFLLLGTLLANIAYAQQTLCYKENLSSISEIEIVKLDGGECKSSHTIKDMTNNSWIVDDIKINTKNNKYSFTYIFKRNDKKVLSNTNLEDKINEILKKEKVIKKAKVLSKDEKISLGEILYKTDCLSCHGLNGNKESRNSKNLTKIYEFAYYQKMSDYSVSDVKSPTAYLMNDVAKFLKDDQVENLYLYIQTLKK